MKPGPHSERAIIYAPGGRDARIAKDILVGAGFFADTHMSLATLCAEIEKGAGLAIIADEALQGVDLKPLADSLKNQPSWSDFPIVLLTLRGGGPERNPAARHLGEALGNVIFLERPFHPMTFISVVRTAVRGRRRQYEARRRLQEVTEGQRQLQIAMETGNLGSWSLDIETMRLHTSDRCKAHFGRGADEDLHYADVLSAVHAADHELFQTALAQTSRTMREHGDEYRIVWPDGTLRWLDLRVRMLRDDLGRSSQLVGVSSDITARKTAEIERERLLAELAREREALSALTASLEERVHERTKELRTEIQAREKVQEQLLQSQKMESIGKLTGGVAHDFNNLLMAVMGNLELLRKRTRDDPRTQRLIEGALQGVERGAALTQRMLAFARQQDLRTSSADLRLLLLGMKDLLDRTLGPQVTLQLEIAANLPPAQVDANQLELAILNLAINSRDAMPNGGVIVIRLGESVVSGRVGLHNGRYLWLQVVDTGVGMDPQTLKMSIEPFFSTKPLGKGTGLGLSMVHGLAVQLGGSLDLDSTIGKGTTATLWLPVACGDAEAEPPAEPTVKEAGAALILVVDDDPLIAMSATDMLEDLGHSVIEAHSARRALDILDREPAIALMMTDFAMPGMTGVELAAAAHNKRPDLQILLTTGYADLPNGQQTALPRLGKPYHQSQLKAEINRLLGVRR